MSQPGDAGEGPTVDGVSNPAVRAAVEAFAAAPGPAASVEVLRQALAGYLLLDVTGSDIRMSDDGTTMQEGSTIRIATAGGPDGGSALVAFTSQAEIARMHPDGEQTQSLVQLSASVLQMVVDQDHRWLYIDPAGPTCALAREEIEFALRVPRNDVVRDAVGAADADPSLRPQLIEALKADGQLSIAVEAPGVEPGVLTEQAQVQIRTAELPDGGGPALLVFTSGPELAARCGGSSLVTQTTGEILSTLRERGFAGMIVNAAGPWAAVTAAELGV